MTEWTLGQRVVFERNADYFRAGAPYLDKITFEVGQEPQVALLRLKRGEVDVLGDPIPSANFLQEKDDPANAGLIIKGDLLHTGYITMNTTKAPFDNKLVRQAVNMAINKERVVRIVNGRGAAAQPAVAAGDARVRHELPGLSLRPQEGQGPARRGRSIRTASRPSSTP